MAWGNSFDKPTVEWHNAPAELKEAATIQLKDARKMYSYNRRAVVEWPVSERNNKIPTHDPYTNPNARLYYSCSCGQILDPGTKRFAELNNCASKAGWKIRFNVSGYVPHCVECGKGIE